MPSVVINGTVEGTVFSTNRLELATHGRVNGDVFYSEVEMAAGSEVNGLLKHVKEPAPATSESDADGSPAEPDLKQGPIQGAVNTAAKG